MFLIKCTIILTHSRFINTPWCAYTSRFSPTYYRDVGSNWHSSHKLLHGKHSFQQAVRRIVTKRFMTTWCYVGIVSNDVKGTLVYNLGDHCEHLPSPRDSCGSLNWERNMRNIIYLSVKNSCLLVTLRYDDVVREHYFGNYWRRFHS